jgi:TolB-like protein
MPDLLSPEGIAHVIQLALTPIFLLSGIATLLNVFATRLARVADLVAQITKAVEAAEPGQSADLVRQLMGLRRRSIALDTAVVLGAIGAAATCASVFTLFVGELREATVGYVLVTTFGLAIGCTISAIGAEPGGVLVSSTVHEQVRDRLPLSFEDLGEQQIKNIARPVRVYRVRDSAVRVVDQSPAAPQSLALPDKPSIAVLPFANLSGDPEEEYFADGMVEEIITALSRIRWLFVIARNSTFTYKGKAVDVKQVARELGVRYVLEGSVPKAENQVRITGQLINTNTAAHIWANRFDGLLDDVFELQDKVASGVVGAIEPKLRQSEIEHARRKPTDSLDAYDLYLRALSLRDSHTDDSVNEAIVLSKQALGIDPSYAPAAALIGWTRIHQVSHGHRPVLEAEVDEAVAFAKRAIETGPDDPDVLWMVAATVLILAGDRSTAAALSDRALAINPNSAHAWMARGWSSFAQPDLAIEALERAMRLSPLDRLARTFSTGIAYAHIAAGRYEQALDGAERALQTEPDYSGGLLTKAIACMQLDRIEQAHTAIQQVMSANSWRTAGRIKLFSRLPPPETAAICTESLRKAGLPECPLPGSSG